jgi:predicted HNH restriction endonuclease
MPRISESDLILPTLYLLDKNSSGLDTSNLITELSKILNPTGEDVAILNGRNDTKFSQIVRNLKSHNTLTSQDYASFNSGIFTITNKGKKYLDFNAGNLNTLFNGNFYAPDIISSLKIIVPKNSFHSKVDIFNENLIINEGHVSYKETKTLKRSYKLRDEAIKKYSNADGEIFCSACEFNFYKVYGELGKGYIEIHHLKPIFNYLEDDFKKTVVEALDNVVPLCSNCHRMVHRNKKSISIEDLKLLIAK